MASIGVDIIEERTAVLLGLLSMGTAIGGAELHNHAEQKSRPADAAAWLAKSKEQLPDTIHLVAGRNGWQTASGAALESLFTEVEALEPNNSTFEKAMLVFRPVGQADDEKSFDWTLHWQDEGTKSFLQLPASARQGETLLFELDLNSSSVE